MTKTCSVEGCEKRHLAKGYCQMHYARVRNYGSTDLPERQPKPPTQCSIQGCERNARALGMCSLHYRRTKSGTPLDQPIREIGKYDTCTIDGCDNKHHAQGLCMTHWDRKYRGKPIEAPIQKRAYSDDDYMDMYVEVTDYCWNWTGDTYPSGRGVVSRGRDGKKGRIMAYRWLYELLVEPIPQGLVLDHLCCNPNCVNPDHLEPVTPAENTRRAIHLGDGYCRAGLHRMIGDNVITKKSGGRQCRACRNARHREGRAQKRGVA